MSSRLIRRVVSVLFISGLITAPGKCNIGKLRGLFQVMYFRRKYGGLGYTYIELKRLEPSMRRPCQVRRGGRGTFVAVIPHTVLV